LFALFLREDAPDVWDLVVAAKWIEDDRPAALADISRRVRDSLRADEITKISRVVIVERTDPALEAIAAMHAGHGIVEVANSTFFGLAIRHAFIITAGLNPPPNRVWQRTAAAGGRR
ncbi:MAG: hypothetical protein ABIS92_02710, partial [Polyangia bacterium]